MRRSSDRIITTHPGRLPDPPNRDAAQWLSDSIAPELWARRPETSIWVVGRGAGALALDPRIEVRADVPALASFLQRSKIAIAPLRIGTGSPNKVLEAMASGAAVVATPAAVASFAFPPGAVETAETTEGLASAVEQLLGNPSARSALVARSSELVQAYSSEAQRERLEAVVTSVAREI